MNENFPKLNSANFTITDDFKKDLARPDYRIILFKVIAHSRGNGTDRETFAYCDYIDEDVIVADLPYKDFGDIQATSLKFMYLPIENDNYRSFLASNASISSVMNDTGWKLAFDEINIDEGEGNIILEPTGSNYIFFDFSDYDLNCSIQLLNTFDKSDREFIHSHYHSKNSGHTDILSTDGYLGYYDDIEYSKFDSSETNTLRDEIKIDSDKFSDGTKPSELKLNHKSNFVRMFRPEEYYHMGDFTVKLLGKPLQETKYRFPINEIDHTEGKESREDLKVVAVTNPTAADQNRDLQYVDMFEYNKYLQPVFRQWDKNNEYVDSPDDTKPYLYTIDKFDLNKNLTTFFRVITSRSTVDVVINFKSTGNAPTADDFTASIYSTEDPSLNSSNHDERFYSVQFSYVDGKLRIYYYMKDYTTILLEAGVKADISSSSSEDNNKKSNVIIKESGITGTGTEIAVTIVTKKDNQFGLIGNTFEPNESGSTINIWNQGKLLPLSDKNPTFVFGNKCTPDANHKSQYAKFIFNDYDTYLGGAIPNGGVAVTLQGGQNSSQSDAVLFGVPYLCVTKNMKVHGTSYLNEVSASNINVSGTTTTKYLHVTDTSTFDKEATFKSTVKFYNSLRYAGTSTRNFINFEDGDSTGDALLISGCAGLTAIGSGESAASISAINTKFNHNNNHPTVSNFSSNSDWSASNEELILTSDNNVFIMTNCQEDSGKSRLFQFSKSSNTFITYGGSTLAAVRAQNNTGSIELHIHNNRGVWDPSSGDSGRWLICYNPTAASGGRTELHDGDVYIANSLTSNKGIVSNGVIYGKANCQIDGTLIVGSTATFNGDAKVTGHFMTGSVGNLIPKATNSGSLGSSSKRWLQAYIKNIYGETVASDTLLGKDTLSDKYNLHSYKQVIGSTNYKPDKAYGYIILKGSGDLDLSGDNSPYQAGDIVFVANMYDHANQIYYWGGKSSNSSGESNWPVSNDKKSMEIPQAGGAILLCICKGSYSGVGTQITVWACIDS